MNTKLSILLHVTSAHYVFNKKAINFIIVIGLHKEAAVNILFFSLIDTLRNN